MALEMSVSERPRERLVACGPEALKTEELLSILFGTGRKGCNVIEMSRELLNKYGSLQNLSRVHAFELAGRGRSCDSVKGIGLAKAVTLLAALELGRRAACEEERHDSLKSRLGFWIRQLSAEEREFIVAVYLDRKNVPIADERLSYGGAGGAVLDAPYLMRRAVRLNCAALVLVHNHPDGSLTPSSDDLFLSRSVAKMLQVLQIGYYGHYIVSDGRIRRIAGDGSTGRDVVLDAAAAKQ